MSFLKISRGIFKKIFDQGRYTHIKNYLWFDCLKTFITLKSNNFFIFGPILVFNTSNERQFSGHSVRDIKKVQIKSSSQCSAILDYTFKSHVFTFGCASLSATSLKVSSGSILFDFVDIVFHCHLCIRNGPLSSDKSIYHSS